MSIAMQLQSNLSPTKVALDRCTALDHCALFRSVALSQQYHTRTHSAKFSRIMDDSMGNAPETRLALARVWCTLFRRLKIHRLTFATI